MLYNGPRKKSIDPRYFLKELTGTGVEQYAKVAEKGEKMLTAAELGIELGKQKDQLINSFNNALTSKGVAKAISSGISVKLVEKIQKIAIEKGKEIANIKLPDIPELIDKFNFWAEGISKIATKLGAPVDSIFSSYLEIIEGGLIGGALSVLGVALLTKDMTGFLIETGKELKKSKGPYAIKAVREFEQKYQPLGIEETKRQCGTRCQNDIYMEIRDAGDFDPYLKTHFPFAYQFITSTNWKKSVENLYLK